MPKDSTPNRVSIPVVIRAGAVGDMVMFLPVLEVLAQHLKTDRIDIITPGGASKKIIKYSPLANKVLVVPSFRTRLWLSPAKRDARDWLKTKGNDPVYIFERKDKLLDAVKAAKIPDSQIRRLMDWPLDYSIHSIDDQIHFIDPDFPKDSPLRYPRIQASLLPIAETRLWLRSLQIDPENPLILMQPGNRRSARGRRLRRASNIKYWPSEHWAQVAKAILNAHPKAQIILCGSPSEYELNDRIVKLSQSPRVHNTSDQLPLDRLMALCTLAHSMVSVDTGPAHIAGALDCPLVVLFGAISPYRCAPRSYAQVSVITDKGIAKEVSEIQWDDSCQMAGISPEMVISAWAETMPAL